MLSSTTTVLALFAGAAAAAVLNNQDESCSKKQVCADYVNECGQMYGGCFSACTPWPSFTAPPCTLTTSSTATPTPTSSGSITAAAVLPSTSAGAGGLECGGSTLCVDHLRTCGTTAVLTFGGCYPACSPSPLYTAPPCPTGAPPPGVKPPPGVLGPCNGTTACINSLKACGTSTTLTYGGCWPACSASPTFSPPPCPTPTPK